MPPEKLTQEKVLDLMQEFVDQCERHKNLKDDLLDCDFFGNVADIDRLHDECRDYDQKVKQIRSIYSEFLLPMMDRLSAFLAAHPDELRLITEEEEMEAARPGA